MGLTRYWYRPPSLNAETFGQWAQDCRSILEAASLPDGFRGRESDGVALEHPIRLRGPDGSGSPIITDRTIALNGDASVGEDHEPFRIDREKAIDPRRRTDEAGRAFEYCKTRGKPYDTAVQACLLALRRRFGAAVVLEGDAEARTLNAGRRLHDALFE